MRAAWLDALANLGQHGWQWDDLDRALTRSPAPLRRLAVTKLLYWCESDSKNWGKESLLTVLTRHCADMQFMRLAQIVRRIGTFLDCMPLGVPPRGHAPATLRQP